MVSYCWKLSRIIGPSNLLHEDHRRALFEAKCLANEKSAVCLPTSLNFNLIWPIRSARVKDLALHLLDIKAICWRLLPPQDIPLMCCVLAIHYRVREAPQQSN